MNGNLVYMTNAASVTELESRKMVQCVFMPFRVRALDARQDAKGEGGEGMSQMICSNCGRYGIYWKDLTGVSPYTYCPHCRCTNCQMSEEPPEEEEEQDEVQP